MKVEGNKGTVKRLLRELGFQCIEGEFIKKKVRVIIRNSKKKRTHINITKKQVFGNDINVNKIKTKEELSKIISNHD